MSLSCVSISKNSLYFSTSVSTTFGQSRLVEVDRNLSQLSNQNCTGCSRRSVRQANIVHDSLVSFWRRLKMPSWHWYLWYEAGMV